MSKLKCQGIGIVIDDQVPFFEEDNIAGNNVSDEGAGKNKVSESKQDLICDIVRNIREDGMPLLRYREIPQPNELDNLSNVAFMLIDWALINPRVAVEGSSDDEDSSDEVDVDITLLAKPICQFIKSFHSKAFAPIFVFSNQENEEIKEALRDNGIVVDVPEAYVLVKPKQEMAELDADGTPKLFNEINNWIQATPTIKLFTSWGNDVLAARNQMFAEFYSKSHNWPSLLWKTYAEDDDDPSQGLSQVMFDNLRGRVKCNISEIPEVASDERTIVALADLLSLTVMLPNNSLPSEQIGCGDLFPNGEQKFFLVVSCDCDCIIRNGETADNKFVQVVTIDDGCKRTSNVMKERFIKRYGLIHEANKSYLFPINKKCYAVKYASHSIIKLAELSTRTRLGRVLPPYITDIRQRLAQWNQRVGFPKLPAELFPAVGSDCSNGQDVNE